MSSNRILKGRAMRPSRAVMRPGSMRGEIHSSVYLSLDVANLLGAGVENLNGVGIVGTDGLVDEADDLIASHGVAIVATDAYNEAAQVAAAEEFILLRGSGGRRKRKRGLRRCCYCCLL